MVGGLTGLFLGALGGRAAARYLLRDCPLPLRGDGEHALRLPGRHVLLVPEDLREDVSREHRPYRGADYLRRVQPGVYPAVCRRHQGDAPSLGDLSREVRDLYALLDRGRIHDGSGIVCRCGELGPRHDPRRKAPHNPWGSNTLEWRCSSPPPYYNFKKTPTADDPYNLGNWQYVSEEEGWVPRTVPLPSAPPDRTLPITH